MKNIVRLFILFIPILLLSSCYDRDIIDSKGTHYILPEVENLAYSRQGNHIKITWQIPDNIPDEFKRPLEISIQKVEDDIYTDIITVRNEETSVDNIVINPEKNYRFVVKLVGLLIDEASEIGISNRIYSKARVIQIQ